MVLCIPGNMWLARCDYVSKLIDPKITAPLHYIREDPMLNTRLLGYAQKDQRKDVFEAVWWQKE